MPNVMRIVRLAAAAALVVGALAPALAGGHEDGPADAEIRELVERIKTLELSEGSEGLAAEIEALVERLVQVEGNGLSGTDLDVVVDVDGDGHRAVKRVFKVKTDGAGEPIVVYMHSDSDDPDRDVIEVIGDGGELLVSKRAFLGVSTMSLGEDLLEHFGVAQESGYLVSSVEPGSAALEAGIEVGDVLTAIDGEPLGGVRSLARAVGEREPGDSVDLELWRDGRMQILSATLEEREGLPLVRRIEIAPDCEPGEDCDHGVYVVGSKVHASRIETCKDGENCDVSGHTLIIEERDDD